MKVQIESLQSWGLAASRVGLGAYFALAGFGKVRGELTNGVGAFRNSESFLALQPGWLPDLLATPYGIVLPWVEVVVGVTLAIGLFTRISAALTLGMLASFTVALMAAAGLSGGAPGPFHPNVLMIFIAVALIGSGGHAFALDQVLRDRPKKRRSVEANPVTS